MVPASANGVLAAPGDALVKPGSVYAFTLGDRRFGVSESMWWSGTVGDTVATSVCAMPDTGGAMCTTAQPGPWIMDVTEESASGNVYVGGLPDNAAYVTLTVGGQEYWQDPVRDLALFPLAVAERPASATVVLSTGEVIELTADRSDASTVPGAVVDEYPSHSLVGARQVMYSVGQACLANADLPDPRGSIPPGTDVDAVWDECVVLADAAVRGFLRTAEAQEPDTPAMPIGPPPSQPTG
jgi:hypothetical protein